MLIEYVFFKNAQLVSGQLDQLELEKQKGSDGAGKALGLCVSGFALSSSPTCKANVLSSRRPTNLARFDLPLM